MLRKQVGSSAAHVSPRTPLVEDLNIEDLATVTVSSEDPDHPIDNVFDRQYGRGGTQWWAGESGTQTVTVAFDAPVDLRQVVVEVEETSAARAQHLSLEVSHDAGVGFREIRQQGYNFSPPATTFEQEEWRLEEHAVTHLRLTIKPDLEGHGGRAKLTRFSARQA